MIDDHDEAALTPSWSDADGLVARVVAQPLQQFLRTEAAGGVVLVGAAVAAIVWANGPWGSSYEQVWSTGLSLHVGALHLDEHLRSWVNDLLMALFFFVAGLEIKREVVHGDLRHARTAALPIACALGGMIAPATIYLALNAGGAGVRGWGIPMATDIAFSIGVMALVGSRTPASLKVFLLTLAIVDDIGAIVVIALFYSGGVDPAWLLAAAGVVTLMLLLRRAGVRWLAPYVVLAIVLWLATFESGVHATIAGVVLGLLTPAHPFHHPDAVQRIAAERLAAPDAIVDPERDEDEEGEVDLLALSSMLADGVSPLTRFEAMLHQWSSYLVLPLFALANAGVVLSTDGLSAVATSHVSLGVILGLVLGKPIGIMATAFLAVRFGGAHLPADAGWIELLGTAVLAGIGFTVSLFVTGLAFDEPLGAEAKLAILVASIIAGGAGAALLAARPARHPLTTS